VAWPHEPKSPTAAAAGLRRGADPRGPRLGRDVGRRHRGRAGTGHHALRRRLRRGTAGRRQLRRPQVAVLPRAFARRRRPGRAGRGKPRVQRGGGADQPLDLRAIYARLTCELRGGRLTAAHLDVDAARVPHARKLTRGTVRHDAGPAQLWTPTAASPGEPTTTHTPKTASPAPGQPREGPEQPHRALLHQLLPPGPGRPTVGACDALDQRRERLEQCIAGLAPGLLRREHQLALAQLSTHLHTPSDPGSATTTTAARRRQASTRGPSRADDRSELRRLKGVIRAPRRTLLGLIRDHTRNPAARAAN